MTKKKSMRNTWKLLAELGFEIATLGAAVRYATVWAKREALHLVVDFVSVLRFYGPINPMGSCRAWSVYLTTLYWAGSVL